MREAGCAHVAWRSLGDKQRGEGLHPPFSSLRADLFQLEPPSGVPARRPLRPTSRGPSGARGAGEPVASAAAAACPSLGRPCQGESGQGSARATALRQQLTTGSDLCRQGAGALPYWKACRLQPVRANDKAGLPSSAEEAQLPPAIHWLQVEVALAPAVHWLGNPALSWAIGGAQARRGQAQPAHTSLCWGGREAYV